MATGFYLNPAHYEPHEYEAMQKLIAKLDENKINPTTWGDYQQKKDKFLIRYLKANKYDVDKTYDKFVKFLEWRKENNVDNVLWERDNDPGLKQVYEVWPVTLHKTDNKGVPVLYEKIGPADVKGMFTAYPDIKYWIRNHILMHEQTNHLIFSEHPDVLERPYEGIIFIEDLQGLSWRHWYTPAIAVMKAVSEIDTNYYPLAVRKLYVINAPSIFTWMWKLVKPWLDPFTANSLSILGSNYYEVLSKEIPPENFPAEYGGQCSCANGCLPKTGRFEVTGDDIVHATVPRHGNLKVPFVVESGCTLKWEFTTRDYDISYGVLYENDDGKQFEVVPTTRCNSQHQKIVGTFTAPQSGTYVLHWDNSYSLMRSKELSYKISVEAAGPQD
jgi:hypothetical protein